MIAIGFLLLVIYYHWCNRLDDLFSIKEWWEEPAVTLIYAAGVILSVIGVFKLLWRYV